MLEQVEGVVKHVDIVNGVSGLDNQQSMIIEKDCFLTKFRTRPILGKYELVRRIAAGSQGMVYLGRRIEDDEDVAMKLELRNTRHSGYLEDEAKLYEEYLSGRSGFAVLHDFGIHDDYRVMVLDLLGPSLADLLLYCGGKFSIKTVLMLVNQLLILLERLHRKVIHRDVKPANCLLGTSLELNRVHLADMGLAQTRVYQARCEGEDDGGDKVGTTLYQSMRAHRGLMQSGKDDLESLGYMMIEFLQGTLPWSNVSGDSAKKDKRIMRMKRSIDLDELCTGLPPEFAEYHRRVRAMRREAKPDYLSLRMM